VLSSSLQGVEETHFLAGLAAEVEYFSLKRHQTDDLPANVKVLDEKPVSIARDEAGLVLNTQQAAHCYDGIFIFRAAMPLNMLLSDLRTEGSYIPVDRQMRTNIPGVFAAGDCTGKPLQVPKAVGEGNIAAISAAEWIARL
jgi:thioredoxin reductase (NADPH)